MVDSSFRRGEASAGARAGARVFVHTAAQDWKVDAIRDDAVLVASELVGKAVAPDVLPIGPAARRARPDWRGALVPLACSSSGRREHGLFLVGSISRAWGVSPTENGKSVWALLPFSG